MKYVFVRVDRVRKLLQAPYDGPLKVLAKKDKYFEVSVRDKPQNISIDRLKPAFVECKQTLSSTPSPNNLPTSQANDLPLPTPAMTPATNDLIPTTNNVKPVPSGVPQQTRSGCTVRFPKKFKDMAHILN